MQRLSKSKRWLIATAAMCLGAVLAAGPPGNSGGSIAYAGQDHRTQAPCATSTAGSSAPVTATTVGVIEQGYYCIIEHYVTGRTMDHRTLLASAFAGLARELDRRGRDTAGATPPALTGDRDRDWAAFSAVYQRVTAHLSSDAALRQAIAAATMTSMVDGLHDNHAAWVYPIVPAGYQPGDLYGLGFATSPSAQFAITAPQQALPPLFITRILGGPAAEQRLRPGDIIVDVNGAAPFVDGIPSTGVMRLLSQQPPRADTVRLRLQRPATGRTWTVTMTPKPFQPTPAATAIVTPTLRQGGIAGIRLASFAPGAAEQVLRAIANLRKQHTLRGVVLDLRGNGGGSPTEVARLLGAFAHGKTWSYNCDAANTCTANRTDDTIPLLHLPLAVLVDRDCASACDAFSGAVKDLRLGRLVGTRTAGLVSGPNTGYLLADNSMLLMPSLHQIGAHGETIDGIGVAPDVYLPLTARDLSNGRDPAAAKAAALLGRERQLAARRHGVGDGAGVSGEPSRHPVPGP